MMMTMMVSISAPCGADTSTLPPSAAGDHGDAPDLPPIQGYAHPHARSLGSGSIFSERS